MKGVFWNKVSTGLGNQCALWNGVDINKLDSLRVDYSFLEDAFSQAEEKLSPMKPPQLSSKPSSVSLLDGKRTQNILISSGRVKKTPEEMVRLVLELNPSELTLELTEMMLTLVPTKEEYKNLKEYPNPQILGKAEQLLLGLGKIPNLKERLECHRITFHWNKTCDGIIGNIRLLSKACYELSSKESISQLQTLMSIILAVGNFLNGGSNRVAAAVKIDSILKFSSIKPNNQKGTLLHFVSRQLRTYYPEACEFYMNWNCVIAANDISFTQLLQEYNVLKNDVTTIEKELNNLTLIGSSLDNPEILKLAQSRFLPFLQQAQDSLKSLEESFRVISSLLQDTSSLFGEQIKLPSINSTIGDPSSSAPTASNDGDPSQKFFQMLSEIITIYRKTDEEMKQILIDEKKSMEKGVKTMTSGPIDDSSTNEISEETKEKLLEDQRKKDQHENLFGRFKNQQEASAADMISQLTAKMKLKKLRVDD